MVAARRLPKNTEAEKAARQHQIEVASRNATEVPMRTAQAAIRLLAALPELAEKGNPNAVSDVGAGALLLDACVEGALLNVGINLSGIEDATFVAEMQRETASSRRSPSGSVRRSWRSSASVSRFLSLSRDAV